MLHHQILKLDQQGHPNDWISAQEAIIYHAKNLVAWQLGDEADTVFRGGNNRITGELSQIISAPIIAVKGESGAMKKRLNRIPTLTNNELFARDQWTCAYCGGVFAPLKLTRDHIIPVSRGGKDTWMNVVAACEWDNHKKDDSLLEECGMELLFAPYTPNRTEHLILKSRKILSVQAEYLAQFIPKGSRAHSVLGQKVNKSVH